MRKGAYKSVNYFEFLRETILFGLEKKFNSSQCSITSRQIKNMLAYLVYF